MTSEPGGPEIPSPAEATDGAELGEEAGDDVLPGTVGFPPTTPSGVGPAGSIQDAEHHDSLADRLQRELPENPPPSHDELALVDPFPSGELDDESEVVGESTNPVGLASPEEAAMHYEAEPQD